MTGGQNPEEPDSQDSPPERLGQEDPDKGPGRPSGEPFRGYKPRPATPETAWSDLPGPIMATLAPPADYPVSRFPLDLADVVEAVQRLAQSPGMMAGAALLGGLALLAQDNFVLETLGPDVGPASLFLVVMADSGLHKSTTVRILDKGHQNGDKLLVARWKAANQGRAKHGLADQGDGPESEETARPTRPSKPAALIADVTADGLLKDLEGGRPSVALWSHEAGVQLNMAMGGSRGTRTMAYLNVTWDGDLISKARVTEDSSVYMPDGSYAVSLLWAGQPDVVAPLMFGPLAENGLLARSLICRYDSLPDLGDPLEGDVGVVRRFNDVVLRVRERQDRGVEYEVEADEPFRVKHLIRLDPGARHVLRTFHRAQRSLAVTFRTDGQRHQSSFAERAAEHAARIAGIFTAWEIYRTGGPIPEMVSTDVETMERAIDLVVWYQDEQQRLLAASGAPDVARWAQHLAKVIVHVMDTPGLMHGGYPLLDDRGLAVRTVASTRGHPDIRSHPARQQRVIALLCELDYIRPTRFKGRYLVHPRLAEALEDFSAF